MSDIMKSIPFGQLMEWILAEHKETGQVFGIQTSADFRCLVADGDLIIF